MHAGARLTAAVRGGQPGQLVMLRVFDERQRLVGLYSVRLNRDGGADFPLPSALPAGSYFAHAVVGGQKLVFRMQVE